MSIQDDNILDGKKVSEELRNNLIPRIEKLREINKKPGLAIILVGENPQSQIYVNMKKRACRKLGIYCDVIELDPEVNEKYIIEEIEKLNINTHIHGILVQLPLPERFDTRRILNSVAYEKDVDGFHPMNAGTLSQNTSPLFTPCTPLGVLMLLDYYKIDVRGMNTVVIGSSNLVGMPLSLLLHRRGATVTICDINTKSVKSHTIYADLVIACCGVPEMVKDDWIRKDAIVVDVGITKVNITNKEEIEKRGKNYKIVGDVDFANVSYKTRWITPVPGGIGPMTITALLTQIVNSAFRLSNKF